MKQSISFFLIINLVTLLNTTAQTVQEVVEFADSKFEQGAYVIASKEYNRALFFGYDDKELLSLKIAACYMEMGQVELAGTFYDRAYRFATTDSIRNIAILGKAYGLLISEEFVLSIAELINMNEHASLEQQMHFHFLKGIAHYGLKQDSASYHEFQQLMVLSDQNDSISELLNDEFNHVFRYNKRYNPKRAYIMSGLFPGSGQISVGAYQEGINSMVLIGGLYLISLRVAFLYSFWDAAIALFPWVQRYYMGGMDSSRELAHQKIDAKRYESYLKILELTTPNEFK